MLTHRHNALLSAMAALLLLTTTGQSAGLSDQLQTTGGPDPLTSRLTTQLTNSSTEEPRALLLSKACRTEDKDFCKNGGVCMYPQDSDKPSCICQSSYSGKRCMFIIGRTQTRIEWEKLIGIGFGVSVLILVLAFIIYCLASKRCIKSAPLKQISPA
uniref:epigen-like n=1 Tax=Gasterosteus aculeatus aculeatus TaxID=481459 RepID=UPI001A99ADB6|nr:epigen-like [Gasterosteus aculeatus aculeatus]